MKKIDKQRHVLYSQLNCFKNKIKRTKQFVSGILSNQFRPYIAYSTGKDSLCLLHLVLSINKNVPVMYHDSGVEFPENSEVLKKAESKFKIKINIVNPGIDVFEIYKKKNAFLWSDNKDYACTKVLKKPVTKWAIQNNKNLLFWGIRKEESKWRKHFLLKYGKLYQTKGDGIFRCSPLADWKKEDVFAYIFGNSIEGLLHPAYYKDKFRNHEDIRLSWYCDPAAISMGGLSWLNYYYPDLYIKLIANFPILMKWR